MTVSIIIWTVFSLFEMVSAVLSSADHVKPNVLTFAFWAGSVILLANGHSSIFFALNAAPALLLFVLGGFDLLVSPPGSDTNRPQLYIASATIRMAFVIACCYTN